MTFRTAEGTVINDSVLHQYFHALVGKFYKVLPIREQNEETLAVYMRSLQSELLGCQHFILDMRDEASFLSLLSILQYLIDSPNCNASDVKREVFKAISICNKLSDKYSGGDHNE